MMERKSINLPLQCLGDGAKSTHADSPDCAPETTIYFCRRPWKITHRSKESWFIVVSAFKGYIFGYHQTQQRTSWGINHAKATERSSNQKIKWMSIAIGVISIDDLRVSFTQQIISLYKIDDIDCVVLIVNWKLICTESKLNIFFCFYVN